MASRRRRSSENGSDATTDASPREVHPRILSRCSSPSARDLQRRSWILTTSPNLVFISCSMETGLRLVSFTVVPRRKTTKRGSFFSFVFFVVGVPWLVGVLWIQGRLSLTSFVWLGVTSLRRRLLAAGWTLLERPVSLDRFPCCADAFFGHR